ncbi:hypothetical protein BDR07DRAFT_1389965, partial [Suillus spraguei]
FHPSDVMKQHMILLNSGLLICTIDFDERIPDPLIYQPKEVLDSSASDTFVVNNQHMNHCYV